MFVSNQREMRLSGRCQSNFFTPYDFSKAYIIALLLFPFSNRTVM